MADYIFFSPHFIFIYLQGDSLEERERIEKERKRETDRNKETDRDRQTD